MQYNKKIYCNLKLAFISAIRVYTILEKKFKKKVKILLNYIIMFIIKKGII